MFRTLSVLALLLGCVDSQNHGMRDDAGSDALVGLDATVADPDATVTDAAPDVPAVPDAGRADTRIPDSGMADGGEATAAFLTISSLIVAESEGLFPSVPVTDLRIRVSAANAEATSEIDAPTKTAGPCEYWPPVEMGFWPAGRYTEEDLVPLALEDVTIRVGGRPAALEERAGVIVAQDEAYVRGADVQVEVRLSSGTIRRNFTVADAPVVTEPAGLPAFPGLVADYVVGDPLAVRWPTTYDSTDKQTLIVAGTNSSLDARCVMEHGAGEVVFPWADVDADFRGGGIEDEDVLNLIWAVEAADTSDEGGVSVRVSHSRSTFIRLSPQDPL